MFKNFILKFKSNTFRLPIWLGQTLSYIPFSYRPMVGKSYRRSRLNIASYETMSVPERKEFIFRKMYELVEYAINNVDFYKDFYSKKGFSIACLKSFDDIRNIPVICKQDLLEYELEHRSNVTLEKLIQNTGGSSGQTLTFYIQPSQVGNEWAHIHKMWQLLGFRPSDLRLFMVGRNHFRGAAEYEFARHTISLNIYKSFEESGSVLKKMIKKYPVYYLHGYPSVMADFARYCESDPELLALLKGHLKGAFLNSEYPYPKYRDEIERVFNIRTQSFYGHTERCVMAYEDVKKFRYIPFQTYGYAEAIANVDGHYDLVGTSYFNYASPLIRYNTKDIIDNPSFDSGILTGFDIFEGRSGQFVIDNKGQKISVTGMIMGRHHPLFDICNHIQIGQLTPGKVIIFVVPKKGEDIDDIQSLFDGSNLDMEFSFEILDAPLRTAAGKVNLIVLPSLIEDHLSKKR